MMFSVDSGPESSKQKRNVLWGRVDLIFGEGQLQIMVLHQVVERVWGQAQVAWTILSQDFPWPLPTPLALWLRCQELSLSSTSFSLLLGL